MSAIMFQGTGSNVGKSLLVAGLCRVARRKGINVAPFKPQNMSNNSFVTSNNGEIGRAQAFQCFASSIDPHTDMNPILLKPESNYRTQIVLNGQKYKTIRSKDYLKIKKKLMTPALDSFNRLKKKFDLIIVEGAGSPSEINLRENDIANMGFANATNLPVVLIGDIERGGVIAQIVGTKNVLSKRDAKNIIGFIVNKFRGDQNLFKTGYDYISTHTRWTGLGVLPWFENSHHFPAEDSYGFNYNEQKGNLKIVCLCLPRISNFDDLDPLALEKNVSLKFLRAGESIPGDARLVIIPGSKSTISDLSFIKNQKWDIDLKAHYNRGNYILGICAGYQMLGRTIDNSLGNEGTPSLVEGLNLLETKTVLTSHKTLSKVDAYDYITNTNFEGYEVHIGSTTGKSCVKPFAMVNERSEGAVSEDGLIMGSYLHGMFCNDNFRSIFLERIGIKSSKFNYKYAVNKHLDNFANLVEKNIDVETIFKHAKLG